MTEEKKDQLEYQRAEKPEFLSETKFEDLGIPEELLSGLKEAGFERCTPIQDQVIPISLSGKDVAGQAQTGTGKTIAFLVTVFSRLLSEKSKKNNLSRALIVAPTRELALQIFEDAELIGKNTDLTYAQVVGGIDYKKQADKLREGPDIVICTPGRVIDYIKQGIFNTSGIEIVVVDEADRLFDLGFTKDMRFILKKLPKYDKRQSLLFSATLSHKVLALTYEYMNIPEFISVTPDTTAVEGIEQVLYHVGSNEKFSLLLGLLEREEWSCVLIFANTKAEVELLEKKLKANGLPAEGITGDLPQIKRLKMMERFKTGKTKILVATDVASRGIHVEDITHVINYDLPQDSENYTHRIGRTARAGKTGKAITMACETYVFSLEAIEQMMGKPIPVGHLENDWFIEDKAPHITARRKSYSRKPVHPRTRPPGNKPTTHKPGTHKPGAKKSHPKKTTYLRNIGWSSEPGGIYGLVPVKDVAVKEKPVAVEEKPAKTPPKKKKKSRPRRKKKPVPQKKANVDQEEPKVNKEKASVNIDKEKAKVSQEKTKVNIDKEKSSSPKE